MQATAASRRGATGDRQAWGDLRQRARALTEETGCGLRGGRMPDPAWLAPATRWLAEAAPDWESLTGDVPTERTWWSMARSPDLDAWLICWPPGVKLAFHDHGGSSGSMWLVDGTLEEMWAAASRGPVRRRHLQAGSGTAFGPGYVHAVANRGTTLVTTVHLYGPPTRPVRDFVLGGGGQLRPVPAGEPVPASW